MLHQQLENKILEAYQRLGLEANASFLDVKKKFKQLALQNHPDKNQAKEAEEKFKEIQSAYEILVKKNEADVQRLNQQAEALKQQQAFKKPQVCKESNKFFITKKNKKANLVASTLKELLEKLPVNDNGKVEITGKDIKAKDLVSIFKNDELADKLSSRSIVSIASKANLTIPAIVSYLNSHPDRLNSSELTQICLNYLIVGPIFYRAIILARIVESDIIEIAQFYNKSVHTDTVNFLIEQIAASSYVYNKLSVKTIRDLIDLAKDKAKAARQISLCDSRCDEGYKKFNTFESRKTLLSYEFAASSASNQSFTLFQSASQANLQSTSHKRPGPFEPGVKQAKNK